MAQVARAGKGVAFPPLGLKPYSFFCCVGECPINMNVGKIDYISPAL
jgi:hypothetical protein